MVYHAVSSVYHGEINKLNDGFHRLIIFDNIFRLSKKFLVLFINNVFKNSLVRQIVFVFNVLSARTKTQNRVGKTNNNT